MARNIQQVFNKVIKDGFFTEADTKGSSAMCLSLCSASIYGSITEEERLKAKASIQDYLRNYGFLRGALFHSNLPCDFAARLAIYKDWENRPTIKH